MSSSLTSNKLKTLTFTLFALAVITGSAILAVPAVNRYRHSAANSLRERAMGEGTQASIVDYYASTILEPRNTQAILTLANMQIAAGDLSAAGDSLRRIPGPVRAVRLSQVEFGLGDYNAASQIAATGLAKYGANFELDVTAGRADCELGDYAAATTSFGSALRVNPADESAQTLLGLSKIMMGEGSVSIMDHITAPEAFRRVTRAELDKVSLAQELYASGLLNAPKSVLDKLPPVSSDALLLSAHIDLARAKPSQADLSHAASSLHLATSLDPTNQQAWQLLAVVDQRLGNVAAAGDDDVKLARLVAGRP